MKSGKQRKLRRRPDLLSVALDTLRPMFIKQYLGDFPSKHTKRKILRGRIAKRKSLMDWVTGRGVSEAGSGGVEGVYCNVNAEESKGKQSRKSDDLPSPEFKN